MMYKNSRWHQGKLPGQKAKTLSPWRFVSFESSQMQLSSLGVMSHDLNDELLSTEAEFKRTDI